MTDDTPPEQPKEADWLSGPCSNSFHPFVGYSSGATLMCVKPVDTPLHRLRCPQEISPTPGRMAPGVPQARSFARFFCSLRRFLFTA